MIRHLYKDIQDTITDYIEMFSSSETRMTENDVKNQSVSVIESIVKKIESIVVQTEQTDDIIQQLQEAVVSHGNQLKKSAIKIEGFVNHLESTNGYRGERVDDHRPPAYFARYFQLTTVQR